MYIYIYIWIDGYIPRLCTHLLSSCRHGNDNKGKESFLTTSALAAFWLLLLLLPDTIFFSFPFFSFSFSFLCFSAWLGPRWASPARLLPLWSACVCNMCKPMLKGPSIHLVFVLLLEREEFVHVSVRECGDVGMVALSLSLFGSPMFLTLCSAMLPSHLVRRQLSLPLFVTFVQ